jgi:hypothetical protein
VGSNPTKGTKNDNVKIMELIPVFVDQLPLEVEEGKMYISDKYGISVHLCACGCGVKTFLPFRRVFAGQEHGWVHTVQDGKVSTTPSIGNWSGENPYHAHYFIVNNKIIWC